MEGEAADMIHVCVRQQDGALVNGAVRAAAGVKDQLQLRQDDAGFLRHAQRQVALDRWL